MPPDATRWQRAKELFHAALDGPPERRAAVVSAGCGVDADLRDDVESLLVSDEAAGDFLEMPAGVLIASRPDDGEARRFLPGSRLGRYDIEAFVGAGAVSEVYRARDTRLGRTVALKVLTDPGAPDAGDWLLLEAQHASTLNHPHISTVYEVDEVGGLPFMALEYVEGTTLHELASKGPLPVHAVVAWGAQIAQALDHAHRHGIVHRDLKGSNVVVRPDGQIKVLDFGLARRVEPAGDAVSATSVLADASVAGTLTHVAPEVFQGATLDARIDIWAFGVMLYEMVTGHVPFRGDTSFATANAILCADPAPMPSTVPRPLQRVITGCLSKDPAARYQTASDLQDALAAIPVPPAAPGRRLAGRGLALLAASLLVLAGVGYIYERASPTTTGHPAARTLAVLPFEERSGDESQRVLADGMTEALIAELGRLEAIRVIARSTTDEFRGRPNAVRDAERETGAGQVLEGSLTRSGDRVRLSARLIEAATGRVIWADEYERHVRELQVLYGVIAAAIADAIEVRLGDEDTRRLSLIRSVDPDVYEAYLKGRYYWNQRTGESLRTAVTQFEAAIALDPSYAPAYAALADCYNQLGTVMVGGGPPQEWRPKAAAAAMRALQIDAGLAEAHATLGWVRHYDWEWAAAEQSLRRAIELNPSYALGRIWYANLLSSRRRIDEAVQQVTVARELDPLSPVINTNVGWILIDARRYDEAIAQLQRTVTLDPSYVQAHNRLANAYTLTGRHQEAITEAETAVRLTGGLPSTQTALVQAYAFAGRRVEAERLLDSILSSRSRRYVSAGALANAYVALGRTDDALSWLEQSYRERTNNMAYLAAEPIYDALRAEPRFQALLRQVGLPQ